ncbi:MAG TPA: heme-binding protein [Croceibacterium sp.]|nr:heme-binding protein [Croceibacterium sp.]
MSAETARQVFCLDARRATTGKRRRDKMLKSTRITPLVLAGLVMSAAGPAIAQPAPPPPRAKGPSLASAVEAAQIAINTCLANGYKTTALVADADGEPVAMLSADGAQLRTHNIARGKVATVIRYKVASGEIMDRVAKEPALAAETKADPKINGFAWRGGVPIMAGGELIGAIAVSGAPGGDKDEACIQPALSKIKPRTN